MKKCLGVLEQANSCLLDPPGFGWTEMSCECKHVLLIQKCKSLKEKCTG